jgi:hypothetical protein
MAICGISVGARSSRGGSHREGQTDPLSRWINGLLAHKHSNVVTVALANKTARMAWALIRNDVDYDPQLAAHTAQ